jgi:cyanoexosortase A
MEHQDSGRPRTAVFFSPVTQRSAPLLGGQRLWVLLCLCFSLHSLLLAWQTQDATLQIVNALAWFGAWLCLEPQLKLLGDDSAGKLGLAAGAALLLYVLWRSNSILHEEPVVFLLPGLAGLGLGLLAWPTSRLGSLAKPFTVLCLPLMALLAPKLLSDHSLSALTASTTQTLLRIAGQDAQIRHDIEVWLPGGGVKVAGPCSGMDVLVMLMVVAAIFSLAFPLRRRGVLALLLLTVPFIALLGNALRISLLALVHASQWPDRAQLFAFFHDDEGSLLFSAITVSAFAALYFRQFERQLKAKG